MNVCRGVCSAGSGIEKPIGEAILQIDMMLGKERKIIVKGESHQIQMHQQIQLNPDV